MASRTIAATPVLLMPGCVPYRIVLRAMIYKDSEVVDEYVVHTEMFDEDDHEKHTGYTSGHYFYCHIQEQKEAFRKAYEKWLEKSKHIQDYLVNGRFSVCQTS